MRWIVDWTDPRAMSNGHVLLADGAGNVVRINDNAQEFWGVKRRDVAGRHWRNVIRPGNDEGWLERLFQAALAGRPGQVRVSCTDGRRRVLVVEMRFYPTTWMSQRAVLFLVERAALAAEPATVGGGDAADEEENDETRSA